ncbi:hypothetical protein [Roseicella aerolata]|uniref:Uncharacterized protein n=1 Tax=Roseicella aerolata TaxID=2883479 RepID=A0A9X1IGY8_9PROT|nr:hypothetical protein [Roseicella aerolata]MCB4823996.1 hypothetical protein [Roseicella aerolata]
MLRPPRRSLRPILLALVLSLAGVMGGIVIGLRLQPPPPADMPEAGDAQAPAEVAPTATGTTAMPGPTTSDLAALTAQHQALRRMLDQEQARLDALTRTRLAAEAEHQARLEALARSRAAAEAQLAALQREIAASQREAATPAPRREAAQTPPPSPAPAPARLPRAEPAGGQPRVFVHHRAGSPAAAEAASALLGSLRDGGFDISELRATSAVPSQRVVRYFHADDAAAAARLAGRLGRGWAIQDFRGYEPTPSPGTLEVWVPDR